MPHGSLVDKTASSLLDRVLDGRFPADRPLPSQDQLADALGVRAAIWAVAALTAASGVLVWLRMDETHRPHPATTATEGPS